MQLGVFILKVPRQKAERSKKEPEVRAGKWADKINKISQWGLPQGIEWR